MRGFDTNLSSEKSVKKMSPGIGRVPIIIISPFFYSATAIACKNSLGEIEIKVNRRIL